MTSWGQGESVSGIKVLDKPKLYKQSKTNKESSLHAPNQIHTLRGYEELGQQQTQPQIQDPIWSIDPNTQLKLYETILLSCGCGCLIKPIWSERRKKDWEKAIQMFSFWIMIVHLLYFIIEASISGSVNIDSQTLTNLGANNGYYIKYKFQIFRLITPAFMHAGLLHLLVNLFFEYQIMFCHEPSMKFWNTIATFFVADIIGNSMSVCIHPHDVSVGASGALFGIYSYYVIMIASDWRNINKYQQMNFILNVINFALITLIFSFTSSSIDWASHLGGLLGGIGMGLLLMFGKKIPVKLASLTMLFILLFLPLFLFFFIENYQRKMESFSPEELDDVDRSMQELFNGLKLDSLSVAIVQRREERVQMKLNDVNRTISNKVYSNYPQLDDSMNEIQHLPEYMLNAERLIQNTRMILRNANDAITTNSAEISKKHRRKKKLIAALDIINKLKDIQKLESEVESGIKDRNFYRSFDALDRCVQNRDMLCRFTFMHQFEIRMANCTSQILSAIIKVLNEICCVYDEGKLIIVLQGFEELNNLPFIFSHQPQPFQPSKQSDPIFSIPSFDKVQHIKLSSVFADVSASASTQSVTEHQQQTPSYIPSDQFTIRIQGNRKLLDHIQDIYMKRINSVSVEQIKQYLSQNGITINISKQQQPASQLYNNRQQQSSQSQSDQFKNMVQQLPYNHIQTFLSSSLLPSFIDILFNYHKVSSFISIHSSLFSFGFSLSSSLTQWRLDLWQTIQRKLRVFFESIQFYNQKQYQQLSNKHQQLQ
ncbi:MAG: putative rhomboid family intramembrane serine protease [Streblomastix strix]|uniref:rhomboid protease n=1 Tax=Streblomastix strix TaxID=222440 RepID=A0A5J4VU56_9EUKA|nr:MAG: putative rhomboid family intramembrane serine protease [Streblomastix strix]